jgi:hypothetical protein
MASRVSFCFAVIDVPSRASKHCSIWRIALIPGGADCIEMIAHG